MQKISNTNNCFAIILLVSLLVGCSQKPNLVITELKATGPQSHNMNGGVELPIIVTIKNKGNSAATSFHIVIEYLLSKGRFEAPFLFTGLSYKRNSRYSSFALSPGHEITVHGKVVFPGSDIGWTAALSAKVMSHTENPDQQNYTDELYTDDNTSAPIKVVLTAAQ